MTESLSVIIMSVNQYYHVIIMFISKVFFFYFANSHCVIYSSVFKFIYQCTSFSYFSTDVNKLVILLPESCSYSLSAFDLYLTLPVTCCAGSMPT